MASRKYRIPLFYLVTTLFWFSLYAYVPTLSPYADSLGASLKMIGLIIGSYGFTQMLLRIPLGILSDSLRKRKIFIILGVSLGFISSLGMALFHSAAALLIFRSLSGAAASTWVAYTVLFSSYYEEQAAPKAIGIINSFNALGQMLAMLLGGFAAQHFGQSAPFIVASIGGIIGVAASLGIVENQPDHREPVKVRSLLEVGMDAQLLLVSGLAILSQLLTFGTVYGFTPMAAKAIGATDFQLGMLTTLSTLPGIFASAMSGSFFAARLGERKTISLGFIVVALSCVVIPYIHNIYLLYISQFIGGFGRGVVFPLLMGLSIKSIAAERRATAMGFFQAIYGLGMFLGPVIVGFLSDTAGMVWGFWAVGIIGVLASVLAALTIQRNGFFMKEGIEIEK